MASAYGKTFELIHQWKPGELPTELAYRDSLAAFLRKKLPKEDKVETEYRHVGTTTDVYVKHDGFWGTSEVFVELKRNLKQKTHYDRLIGQIHGLKPKENKIIVVLCGEASPALVSRFKEHFAKELYTMDESIPGDMAMVLKCPQ